MRETWTPAIPKNERFHKIIHQQSGNGALAHEASKLPIRPKPFHRQQLRI